MNKLISLFLSVALLLGLFPANVYAQEPSTRRIAGANRYETAAEIAQDTYPGGCDTVVLANGENYPDALSASPLAVFMVGLSF